MILKNSVNILLIYLFSYSASAAVSNFDVKLTGDKIDYISGVSYKGSYISSSWQPEKRTLPTNKWYAAFKPTKGITFTSKAGDQVVVDDLTIDGIQLKTDTTFSRSTENAMTTPTCSVSEVNGNIVTLKNNGMNTSGCSQSNFLESSMPVSPFYFVRPIINLGSLTNKFEKANSGLYSGSKVYNYRIYYQLPNGVITYLNLTRVVNISIALTSFKITSLKVTPSNGLDIELQNDTLKETLSGQGDFNVQVNGILPNGLKMTLNKNNGDIYFLKHYDGAVNYKIPFSIKCDECINKNLVDHQGKVINNNTLIPPSSITGEEVNFNLTIGLSQIDKASVYLGKYSGNFTASFKPDI